MVEVMYGTTRGGGRRPRQTQSKKVSVAPHTDTFFPSSRTHEEGEMDGEKARRRGPGVGERVGSPERA